MKRKLTMFIDAGEKTCASEPGKFCPHMRTSRFGTRWNCDLFGGKELTTEEPTGTGWLKRLHECVASENGLFGKD